MTDQSGVPSCFVRKSFKYWVLPQNLPIVKEEIAKHLPEFRFKEEGNASATVQSIYLDNDAFDLYCQRLLRFDSSRLIRIRWYGDDDPKILFIEQKLHKNTWQGDVSVKKRFTLPKSEFFTFLSAANKPDAGEDLPRDLPELQYPEQKKAEKSTEVNIDQMNLEQLPREIQDRISNMHLIPKMMIRYHRTRFQLPDDPDPPVRIGLDEGVECASTDLMAFDWKEHVKRLDDSEKYRFPFAILEIKVKLDAAPAGSSLLPEWAQDLVDQGLIMHVHKFSKYAQSTSTLHWDSVNIVPKWLQLIPKFVYQIENSSAINIGGMARQKSSSRMYGLRNRRNTNDDMSDSENEDKNVKKPPNTPAILPPKDAQLFKIQPKEYFANERTFLQWVRSSILIALLGVAILSLGFKGEWISGLVLVVASQIIMARSLWIFLRRGRALRTRQGIEVFDDKVGPMALVCAFVLATALYAVYAVILVEIDRNPTTPAAGSTVVPA